MTPDRPTTAPCPLSAGVNGAIFLTVGLLSVACNIDRDNDGYPRSEDCDDRDEEIYPGAEEQCNGLDNDCDGVAELPICEGAFGPTYLFTLIGAEVPGVWDASLFPSSQPPDLQVYFGMADYKTNLWDYDCIGETVSNVQSATWDVPCEIVFSRNLRFDVLLVDVDPFDMDTIEYWQFFPNEQAELADSAPGEYRLYREGDDSTWVDYAIERLD